MKLFNKFYWTCVLFGICLFFSAPLLIIIFLVFSIYHFIICNVIAPINKGIGEPIKGMGNWFATEFLKSKSHLAPRSSIVTNLYIEGTVPKEEVLLDLKKKWIEVRDQKGNSKYPELQQYIEEWMGFMFWKQDRNFNIENHVITHDIGDDVSPMESKRHVDQLIETLVNKPFVPKRSPWDAHLIYNYRDPELLQRTQEKRITVALFRCHHSMADGFSIITLLLEDILGLSLSNCMISSSKVETSSPYTIHQRFLFILRTIFTFPLRFFHDIGFAMIPILKNIIHLNIPLPDSQNNGHPLLYSRSRMIPIQKFKDIKNKAKCSFSSIMFSSVSAAITEFCYSKGYVDDKSEKRLPLGIPFPAKLHSKRLSNEVTGAILHLCIDKNLSPIERLQATERILDDAKESVLPLLIPVLFKFASFLPAKLVQLLFKNRIITTGVTSFPGPGIQVSTRGRKVLTSHFAAGILTGVSSLGIMALSYHDHIQFSVVVDSGLFTRKEAEKLVSKICQEIESLEAICMNKSILHKDD